MNGEQCYLDWQNPGGWFRIAELICNKDSAAILMEFMFMAPWGNGSSSSIKVEVGWINRCNIILENTKNIPNTYNELQYTGIRIYKSNDNANVIYIDIHSPRPNSLAFSVSQYSTHIDVYARILDFGLKMDDELDTSVYTVLKQIDLNTTSDTYTSTLSRISTLESKVASLENS